MNISSTKLNYLMAGLVFFGMISGGLAFCKYSAQNSIHVKNGVKVLYLSKH